VNSPAGGDRFVNVHHVIVGYPHHPWGNADPNPTVASCMITIDVPLR
jgi:hypothetical protein